MVKNKNQNIGANVCYKMKKNKGMLCVYEIRKVPVFFCALKFIRSKTLDGLN